MLEALTFNPSGDPEVTINLMHVPTPQALRDTVELAVTTLSLPKPFNHKRIHITIRNAEWWAKNVHKNTTDALKTVRPLIETVAEDIAAVAANYNKVPTPEINCNYWS